MEVRPVPGPPCTKISSRHVAAGVMIGAVALATGALLINRTLGRPSKMPRVKPVSLEWAGLSENLKETLFDFNSRAAELSKQIGREQLNSEELAAFIDPSIPMQSVLARQQDLGHGSFRFVWQVEGSMGPFAVKTTNRFDLAWDMAHFREWVNEAKREFEIGLSIHHPNIMKTHHFAIKQEGLSLRAYTLCEYVPGVTASHAIHHSRMSETVHRMLATQAGQVAKQMTNLKIAARDLHASNVMVTRDQVLKFIDIDFWELNASNASLSQARKEWDWVIRFLR